MFSSFPAVGLVVGTFAAVPYVHLHLEMWRRHYSSTPILISDDGSPMRTRLSELCAEYGASFTANAHRLRRTVGDLSAYVNGFDWAQGRDIELLVKMSRRFIPVENWVPQLQALAHRSQMPTFSQSCDHFKFGFRTECIGFHCGIWRASGKLDRIRSHVDRDQPVFVEGFIHQLAREIVNEYACPGAHKYMRENPRQPDRDRYAVWDLMPDRRTTASPRLLWHDCNRPEDYFALASSVGLRYKVEDFRDPNQRFGLGDP